MRHTVKHPDQLLGHPGFHNHNRANFPRIPRNRILDYGLSIKNNKAKIMTIT